MSALRVDIWSDIACPWCWVGKRHLEAAARDLGAELDVTWRAFQLDPSAPKAPRTDIDYLDRLAAKYMTSRAGAQSMVDRMTRTGAEAGLEFRFDRATPANTFDGHRLLAWTAGKPVQDELSERLFRAYMNEGRNVADHETLIELAADVGLEPDEARAILATDAYADDVRADLDAAGEMCVTGVPFFLIERRFAIPGAQPPDLIRQFLERALRESQPIPAAAGVACGPDGCD